MKYQFLLAASLSALAACGAPRGHQPAVEPGPPVVAAEPDAEGGLPPPAVFGLEIVDGEGLVSVLDAGPQDEISGVSPPKFALHCDTAARTLEVLAPVRQLGPYAVPGSARFIASGEAFAGDAVIKAGDITAMSLTLALTPELLERIATTQTARLAIGDGFAESNLDTNGAFPGFVGQCSLESGVPLPPR
ncbi:MAG: hypothetical protein ACO33A_03610 [Hyphomonas sp.]